MINHKTVRGVIVAVLVLLPFAVAGRATDRQPDEPRHAAATIAGSWVETTTIAGGPTFGGLVTFDAAGTVIGSYQGNVNTGGPVSASFTASHGRWTHEGGRTYSTTAVQLVSDLAGNLLFVNKLRQRITLGRSRDTYRSVVRAEFHDPAGNLLFVSEGTTAGTRVQVEPLPVAKLTRP